VNSFHLVSQKSIELRIFRTQRGKKKGRLPILEARKKHGKSGGQEPQKASATVCTSA
jgi:hypothetical protein